jgi:hypothetical protein
MQSILERRRGASRLPLADQTPSGCFGLFGVKKKTFASRIGQLAKGCCEMVVIFWPWPA